MTTVAFTHFYLPNGRQVIEEIDMRDEVAPKIKEIEAAGCRLTAEVLMTGHCSFCIESPDLGDFDQILTANGPQLIEPLHEMILKFNPEQFEAWKKKMEAD